MRLANYNNSISIRWNIMKLSKIMPIKNINTSKCSRYIVKQEESSWIGKEILKCNYVYSMAAFFKLHAYMAIGIG